MGPPGCTPAPTLTAGLALCSSLDLPAMQEAAQHLLGTHDFSAFQSVGSPSSSPVRTMRRVAVAPSPSSPLLLPEESR